MTWGRAVISDADYLRATASLIRAVAADCFDLRAKERLNFIAGTIEEKATASGIAPVVCRDPDADRDPQKNDGL
jgi:hypothetical protein